LVLKALPKKKKQSAKMNGTKRERRKEDKLKKPFATSVWSADKLRVSEVERGSKNLLNQGDGETRQYNSTRRERGVQIWSKFDPPRK